MLKFTRDFLYSLAGNRKQKERLSEYSRESKKLSQWIVSRELHQLIEVREDRIDVRGLQKNIADLVTQVLYIFRVALCGTLTLRDDTGILRGPCDLVPVCDLRSRDQELSVRDFDTLTRILFGSSHLFLQKKGKRKIPNFQRHNP